jgi:hypothetical protein
MTTALTDTPKFRAIDSNGDPLVGGKLYTYVSGTTTPKTSYKDSAQGQENTNPVILDDRGQGEIWLDGLYTLTLDDADDVTQWSVDGISSGEITTGPSLPTIISGDADKFLSVKADESGYENKYELKDEDEMTSNSAASVATQQSVKAYVDSGTVTMTNKTIDADGTGNSITNIEDANIKTGAAIGAAKIADGSVSDAEFQYLDGVTSAIQGQIDGVIPATTVMLFQQAAAPTGWTVKNSWSSSTSIVIVNAADYSDGIGNSSGDSPTSWTTNVQVAAHANHTHAGPSHRHTYTTTPYHNHYVNAGVAGAAYGQPAGGAVSTGGYTNYAGSATCYTQYDGTEATDTVSTASAYDHVETQDTYAPRYQHVIAATKDA